MAVGSNKSRFGEREIWLIAPTGELERKLLDADESSAINGLFWAQQGQRVIYIKTDKSGDSLLSRDLNGGPPIRLISPSGMKNLNDVSWLPSGQLLYSLREPTAAASTDTTPGSTPSNSPIETPPPGDGTRVSGGNGSAKPRASETPSSPAPNNGNGSAASSGFNQLRNEFLTAARRVATTKKQAIGEVVEWASRLIPK
jgi:hypothetical protein